MKINKPQLIFFLTLLLIVSNPKVYVRSNAAVYDGGDICCLSTHTTSNPISVAKNITSNQKFKFDNFCDRVQKNKFLFAIIFASMFLLLLQIHIQYLKKKLAGVYGELKIQNERFKTTLSSLKDSVITTNEKGMVTFSNPEMQKLLGMGELEIEGREVDKLLSKLHVPDGNVYKIPIEKVIDKGLIINIEGGVHLISKGQNRLLEGTVAPIRNYSGTIIGMLIALKDITELKEKEKILYNMEYYDSLTGLPNRSLFSDRLGMAIAQAKRNNEMCGVIVFDLDNFKSINDTLGHSVGDMLLVQVGQKVKNLLREVDTVARIGGDEFIILQPQIKRISDVTRVADRIIKKFQNPWILQGKEYYITASMGIGIYPDDGRDEQTIFKNADTALNRAKELGRNNYQLYAKSMNAKIKQRLETENSLRKAVEREAFVLFYQPQIDLLSGQIVGLEALIRWHRPGYGLVPPMEFIPLAEESGLIVPIGEWVLKTALEQSKRWIDAGIGSYLMAINLSARQFRQRNLVEIIETFRNNVGLSPELVELEVTESTAMQDLGLTIDTLNCLREKGIGIALDDFGIGYSALNYLRHLPINTLKIDKSFVQEITTNFNAKAIANTVISLAHRMNLTVVAEGVETKEQLSFLKDEGCDRVQGYLFSKPLPANEIEMLLRNKTCFREICKTDKS